MWNYKVEKFEGQDKAMGYEEKWWSGVGGTRSLQNLA